MKKKILEIRDLHVHFYTYAGVVQAISGVWLEIYEGESFCIVGETGCGKTVTSRAITRLVPSPGKIVKGEILYYKDDKPIDLLKLPEDELRKIRGNEIAYIFQDPTAALDPLYTAGEQITETIFAHRNVSKHDAWREAVNLLKSVLIPDPEQRVRNYPHELSVGMRQRVVISIGLSNRPRIIIADEPTSAVDVTIQAELLDLLRELKEKYNTTIILITHNMGVVAEMCDRVAVMYAGRIAEVGNVFDIFKNPRHPYTQGLLRAVPNPLTKVEKLEYIEGSVPNLIYPPSGCRFHPRCKYVMDICKEKHPPFFEPDPDRKVACWLYSPEKMKGE